jgi:hypothetical protein
MQILSILVWLDYAPQIFEKQDWQMTMQELL